MRLIAETLAQDFIFVRIDLYGRPEGVLVGEITHAPLAGLPVFDPPEWDERLGGLWTTAEARRSIGLRTMFPVDSPREPSRIPHG